MDVSYAVVVNMALVVVGEVVLVNVTSCVVVVMSSHV